MTEPLFDPTKVERTKWVYHDYEGYEPNSIGDEDDGDGEIRYTVEAVDFDKLLSLYQQLHEAFTLSIIDARTDQHWEDPCAEYDHWMNEARKKISNSGT